jgi:hypothetical protein
VKPTRLPLVVLAILGAALGSATAGAEQDAPVWAPLIGHWTVEPGQPGGGSGWTSFEPALQGRALLRRNHAEYPPAEGRPATVHDDLMVLYLEGGKVRADYWDNEGHVIRYAVAFAPEARRLVFLSDETPGAPRFRLTYDWSVADQLAVGFEIAPPNAPEAFELYLSGTVRRTVAGPR